MTVPAIVPQLDPPVVSPVEAARYIATQNAITFSEVAERMAQLADTGYAASAAQIRQAALALALEQSRVTFTHAEGPASYLDRAPWLRTRPKHARSTSRRRKNAKTCKVCIRMGRPCSWHGGGTK